MSNFGERIKEIRDKFNLTQSQLGDKLGVSSSYISRVENNKETPSDTFIFLFCNIFFIRKEWLMNGELPIQKNPGDIATVLTWYLNIDSIKEVAYHLYNKFLEPAAMPQEIKAIKEEINDPALAAMISYLKDKWQTGDIEKQIWLKVNFGMAFRDFEK
ncbi:MAG: helix-turn-helix domain-containing protein [Bacteroidota bacterium]